MHKHDTPRWDEQAWGTAAGRLRGIKLTLCVLVGCVVLAGSLGL